MLRSIDLKKDYYKILGVDRSAKPKEIRSKYFEAAKKYHPDVTGKLDETEKQEANSKFLLISQAYEILSNKSKRRLYDEERARRNYNDPNEIKKDFYKNILRRARQKGLDLNKFETEQDAYKWWQEEQKKERQSGLKLWRRKVKQHSASKHEDYNYLSMMNQNIMNAKERIAWRNAFIAVVSGVGIYMLFRYITSDTVLSFPQYYLSKSPLLQQLANRYWYKYEKFDEESKRFVDDDGNVNHFEYGKQQNILYDHKRHASHSAPPSLAVVHSQPS